MQLFPAIDLKNGQCVRLTQGDFDTAKVYESDPFLQAEKFVVAGASWVHIVDLDGALAGETRQIDLISELAKRSPLKIQTGGGIRSAETIKKLLDSGVARVVVGSLAVKNKPLVEKWLKEFGPERIVLAFDVKFIDDRPEIMTHGWRDSSRQILWDVLDAYKADSAKHILCTDVTQDGMLLGPNIDLYRSLKKHAPHLEILASGGVESLQDLETLSRIPVAGAIVGKAIYEGLIDLAQAIQQEKAHAG